jgi:hypothetical protein
LLECVYIENLDKVEICTFLIVILVTLAEDATFTFSVQKDKPKLFRIIYKA